MSDTERSESIIASAEPLTPEQREARLRELADWGVDLSLIQSSLARTPTERVQHMVGLLRIIEELRRTIHEPKGPGC
jgi:hypothetical protein